MKKQKVLIIGAGPAGLAAAYKLLKDSNKYDVTILEKEKEIGGLCKTISFKNKLLDYGVHFYRISEYKEFNDIVYNLIPIEDNDSINNNLISKYVIKGENQFNTDNIMLINSATSNIYFNNKFYAYPIKINLDTIKKMGIINLFKIGFSYLKVLIHKKEETNLENYYINRYGKKFYEMFFLEYTKKVCGVDPKDIHIDWGKQRIRETSLLNILKEKIFKKRNIDNEPSLIEEYYYPKYGCGEVYKNLSKEIEKLGGKIITNSNLKSVELENNEIKEVCYTKDKNLKTIKPDYLVNSAPMKEFIKTIKDKDEDKSITKLIRDLPFRDLILVNLVFSKKELMKLENYKLLKDNSWVFIQDPNIRFGRIKLANVWSSYMLGEDSKDKVVMTLEYCCDSRDPFSKLKNNDLLKEAKKELKILKLFPRGGILEFKIDKIKNAYPAYYGSYNNRGDIINYLDKYRNIYFVGRAGQHQYIDMDKAMITGLSAAKSIIEGDNDKKGVWL